MQKNILALAFEAGIKPFDPVASVAQQYSDIGDLAARLLKDRNPYFDKEYRDRFGTRVHSIEVLHDRLVLGCIESAQPADGTARRFRAVLFRCDGHIIHQTPDNRKLGRYDAVVDLHYNAGAVTEEEVLRALCMSQLKVAQRMVDCAERVLQSLNKQGP